jgi:formylglycine-generating enzyme required for sulfatase activity
MKVNLLRIFIIIASTFILFTANPALSYVPDDLDFVPMGDGAVSIVQPAAHSRKTYTVPSINYKMVYISPGTFMMGSSSGEPERDSDERQHIVTLTNGFYMGATEVTQGQWKAIMGNNPSYFNGDHLPVKQAYFFNGDNLPVERVSWNDCQEFIRKLNRQEGGNKYRLPTEAEWEYACMAGTTMPFYTGICISTDQANYDGNWPMPGCSQGRYREKTIEVASFSSNAWGLYDMHGNVWEWCQDLYGYYPSGHVTDPEGPSSGSDLVLCGGSCKRGARRCRSADRHGSTPGFGGFNLGFRLTRTP